jgi:hypothetical protein
VSELPDDPGGTDVFGYANLPQRVYVSGIYHVPGIVYV